MNFRVMCFATFVSLFAFGPSSVFADVIIDPDNTGANWVLPSDPAVLSDFTELIFVGVAERDGTLEVNADSLGNGITAISGNGLFIGEFGGSGTGGLGTVRIIGNGTSGSARIDIIEGGFGLANGIGGNGVLDIRNGGVLESQGTNIGLGLQATEFNPIPGNATTNVDGQGSILRASQAISGAGGRLGVGEEGISQSTLNVTNGGLVEALGSQIDGGDISIGIGTAGTVADVNVIGEGSTLRASQFIQVGSQNGGVNANLNVSGGGRVEVSGGNPEVNIATLAGQANVTVSGSSAGGVASSFNADDIAIGGDDLSVVGFLSDETPVSDADFDIQALSVGQQVVDVHGNLLFKANGDPVLAVMINTVTTPETLTNGNEIIFKGTGSLVVENGAQVAAQDIHVSENIADPAVGTFNGQGGTLTVRDGGSVTSDVVVNKDGLLNGDGTINGTVTVQGGTVAPGNSPGTMTINGDFVFTAGELGLEANSLFDKDFFDVTGNVFIGPEAILNISLGFDVGTALDIADVFFNTPGLFTVDPGFGGASNINLLFAAGSGLVAGEFIDVTLGNSTFSIAGTAATEDVTWSVTGMDVDLVVCKNKTTGEKARIDVGAPASGSCGDLGLTWNPGDYVQVKVVGTVQSVAEAGGVVAGIDADLTVCKNRSTEPQEKVRIEDPPSDWNWSDGGLPLTVGDRVQWKAKGLAN